MGIFPHDSRQAVHPLPGPFPDPLIVVRGQRHPVPGDAHEEQPALPVIAFQGHGEEVGVRSVPRPSPMGSDVGHVRDDRCDAGVITADRVVGLRTRTDPLSLCILVHELRGIHLPHLLDGRVVPLPAHVGCAPERVVEYQGPDGGIE